MRAEFSEPPIYEGIFGPEVLINTVSGVGYLRGEDSNASLPAFEARWTNAFVVWLGRPIVVVSEGVSIESVPRIAAGIRQIFGEADIPVVVSLEPAEGQAHVRAMADKTIKCTERELARAEAYVVVQAGWVEVDTINVELNGDMFVFQVEFRRGVDGTFIPSVR